MSNTSNFQKRLLEFTLSLYNNYSIPRNAIEDFIHSIDDFIADIYVPHLIEKINKELSTVADKSLAYRVRSILKENKSPFTEISTEYRHFKAYEKYCGYIPPQQYKIGDSVDKDKAIEVFGIHIPLQKTLQNFL